MDMDFPSGIILAGGSSRRMGKDKALLPFPSHAGEPSHTFLERIIHEMSFCCSEIVIVARDQQQASRYAHADARIVLDSIPGAGPLVGLYSGLQAISTSRAIVVAVDMPFVTSSLLAYLLLHCQEDFLLVPLGQRSPPGYAGHLSSFNAAAHQRTHSAGSSRSTLPAGCCPCAVYRRRGAAPG